mgnify:CR=1 FL=1
MGTRTHFRLIAAVAVSALLVACNSMGNGSSDGSAGDVPAPRDLADALLTAGDLPVVSGLEWLPVANPDMPGGGPGVVPEGSEAPPLGIFCAASESELMGAQPAWQAYTVFAGESVDVDVESVAVTENLFAGEPATIDEAFETLKDTLTACLVPEETRREDGVELTAAAEAFEGPAVGEDRFAVMFRVKSDSDDVVRRAAERLVVFRQGPVLAGVMVGVSGTGGDLALTEDDIAQIVEAAAANLP